MADQARLHLVNSATGEASPNSSDGRSAWELAKIVERQEAELNGYRLRLGNLERLLEEKEEKQPEVKEIREVLEYWAKKIHTGNGPGPRIVAGSERWQKVKARLVEGFLSWELKAAVDGALMDKWTCEERHRLDAKMIFRSLDSTEAHRDRWLGEPPPQLNGNGNGHLPKELQEIDLKPLLRECGCGHVRLEHSKADPARGGRQPCLRCDECEDFDDFDQRCKEWVEQRRRDRARGLSLTETAEASLFSDARKNGQRDG